MFLRSDRPSSIIKKPPFLPLFPLAIVLLINRFEPKKFNALPYARSTNSSPSFKSIEFS